MSEPAGPAPAPAGPAPAPEEVGVGQPGPAEPEAEPEAGGTILTDVAALEAERDEYLAALQRLKADFENYRKRVLRQQEEQAARAEGSLVAKLLPVLDNLDLAAAHLGEDEEGRAVGQARAQILDALSRQGLERVDGAEVPFDPVVHDAVAHSPAGPEQAGAVVDEVMRAGYRWRGQVLRPAMVRVRG
ncbi:MAG: nucleotide exchange factor GrpE [Acidimicrobiales bacterium]